MTGFNEANIPKRLTNRHQWVNWKYVNKNGTSTKVPFMPNGQPAKSNDPSTWSPLSKCLEMVDQFDGVGFMFSSDDPFVGVDLDGCRNSETGEIASWAQGLIEMADSYTEVSPSGTGVKIFVQGDWPHRGKKAVLDSEPTISSKQPGIEVYAGKRYFTVTSDMIPGRTNDVEERQEFLDFNYRNYFSSRDRRPKAPTLVRHHDDGHVVDRARKYVEKIPGAVSGRGGHNQTFYVACSLVLGFGLDDSSAMNILQEYNERCDPPWSVPDLQHKLTDAANQTGPRNYLRDASAKSVPHRIRQEVSRNQSADFQFADMQALTKEYIEGLEINGKVPTVSTGIKTLDNLLMGGFRYGDFVALGGLSGHLKSGFAQQLGHHITGTEKQAFAFVSLEMSPKYMAERTIQYASSALRKDWHLLTEQLKLDMERHFSHAAPFLIARPIPSLKQVVDTVERLFDQGTRVVAVDYLQLITARTLEPPHIVLGQVTDRLKRLAESYDGIVLGLAQLLKSVSKERGGYIPTMADIEYGSRLYQTSDVCLVGLWPHKIDSSQPRDKYHVHLIKQRDGEANDCIKCRVEPSRMRVFEPRQVVAF